MPPGEPALLERDGALRSLAAALARPPVIVVVEGEPGIGKTSLVHRALAQAAPDARRLVGAAHPTLTGCPLGPVIEAVAAARPAPARPLNAVTGALRPVLPDLAGVLPPPPPPLPDPHLARHRLVRAMAALLAGLGPAVLVLEDLQWADRATLELVRMLGARPPPELSVVVTCAPPAALTEAGPDAVRLHLPPLSPDGTRRLAEAVLGEPETTLPRHVADVLHARSAGVPLAVREDVRLLRRRGLLRPVDGRWVLGAQELAEAVPPRIAAQVLARIGRLEGAGAAALEAAAVLAEAAEPEPVAAVAGLDADRACAALAEAVRHGLLREQDTGGTAVRFRHELARLAVYRAIPGPRRRRLHALAARELARSGRTGLLVAAAEHHRRAGDVPGWAACAAAAAERAAAEGAFETAHALLQEVLRAGAVTGDRRTELAVRLGWAAPGCADRAGTTAALLADARRRAAAPERRAELLVLWAWSLLDGGASRREMERAAAELYVRLGALMPYPELYAIALTVLAAPDRLPGHALPVQLGYLDRARAALAQTADPMAHAAVLTGTAHSLLACGDPKGWAAAEALPDRTDRPEVNRQLLRGLLDLAEAALHLGHYARGLEFLERGRRLAAATRITVHGPRLRAIALRIRWTMGQADAAEGPQEPPSRQSLALRLVSAQICAGQGRMEEARRALRAVAEEAHEIGELAVAAHAVAELNKAALSAVHRRAGRALARRVLAELAGKQIWVWAAPLLPFVPLDLVEAVLPRYREALAGRDAPLARAALELAEARLSERRGDAERAAAGYRSARRRYAALPDPRMAAQACLGEARCRLAAGQAVDAELLRRTWRTLTELGELRDADRLKQLMRTAGLPVPHRRGRPGYGDRLSPREQEIAALAASGRTNGDIAAALCLAERTVKYHLANAMRKLQVSNRRQLRDALEAGASHICRCARCGRGLNPS